MAADDSPWEHLQPQVRDAAEADAYRLLEVLDEWTSEKTLTYHAAVCQRLAELCVTDVAAWRIQQSKEGAL